MLNPSLSLSALFPANTVLAPRTTVDRMCWVTFQEARLDAATGLSLAIAGSLPMICHARAVTPAARALFALAGIEIGPGIRTYTTLDEAIALARACQARGQRLAYYYPPPPEVAHDAGLVVPVSLYDWLNDKANIDQLCDAAWLPQHRLFPPDDFTTVAGYLPERAVFIKACHPGVSGGGADVRYCPDAASRKDALQWLATRPPGVTALRVEAAEAIVSSWCLNVAITRGETRYLGAATQLFSAPAQQCGSLIAPDDQPDAPSIAVALAIAENARCMGYVGIAGFDIGVTPEGGVRVFDLNFRLASCTEQVLLHQAATRRIGAQVSKSWQAALHGAFETALQRLQPYVADGRLVPLRLYRGSGSEDDPSRLNGMLVGGSRAGLEALQEEIRRHLADLQPT